MAVVAANRAANGPARDNNANTNKELT